MGQVEDSFDVYYGGQSRLTMHEAKKVKDKNE